MKDKHKTPYAKKQAKAKKAKASKVPRAIGAGIKSQGKSYTFQFKPAPQVLTANLSAGSVQFSTAAGAGTAPLSNGKLVIQPSSNGLSSFHDVMCASSFILADLASAPTYTGLFDAYKIRKVTMNIEYLNNQSTVSSSGLMPTLYTYWDQDDDAIPATVNDVTRRTGVKKFQFGHGSKTNYSFSIKPTIGTALSTNTGGLIAAGIQKAGWINCTQFAIPHYAMKFALTDLYLPGTPSVQQAFRINWTYTVSFRAPLRTN